MPIIVLQRRVLHIFCYHDLSLFKVKLFFIHHFLRRLLTLIILLAGHTIARLTDFIIITTKNITGFWDNFGYGKYLIVPFWYASAAYQARLARTMARPNSPDMPPKRTKKVRLGIKIKLISTEHLHSF